ncbi:MAG: gliding motility-associated C-terminal domain-containing protein [Chitinophagaceae bacterium]|nr:gliding motility-associated C-terminal domain-containing protein [Chitinophagaceae bacterium]
MSFSQCLNLNVTGTPCFNNTLTANLNGTPASLQWLLNGTVVKSSYPTWNPVASTVAGVAGVSGSANNLLTYPSGIFVDNSGNLYVADEVNFRIQKFAPGSLTGVRVAGGSFGNQFDDLNGPSGIWVASNGDMYITDQGNHRIQKWFPGVYGGVTVAGNGGPGSALHQLNQPTVMYMDAYDNMYISDAGNHRIVKWAPGASSGVIVAGNGTAGSGANQLNYPTGVWVDKDLNVYALDQGNNRVQKWAPGATSGVTVAGGNGAGSGANQFNLPRRIYGDYSGNLYITDQGNNRVQMWTPGASSGTTLAGGNGVGTGSTQFNNCWSVFVDKNGSVYTGDHDNFRVQKISLTGSIANTYTPPLGGSYAVKAVSFTECITTSYPINVLGNTWYRDADGDGFGKASQSQVSCSQPAGYVLNNLDCNDSYVNTPLWKAAGVPGLTPAAVDYTSIAIGRSNIPYIFFQDNNNGQRGTVMKYNGSTWSAVGLAGFTAGAVYYCTIAVAPDGTPYVAYQDHANGDKVSVMKFNGTSWVTVGTAGFTAAAAYYSSIKIDDEGSPYVAFYDASTSYKASVMKFNGSNWALVGSAGFSQGQVAYTSLAIDKTGFPFVVYRDQANSNKATVMRYNGSAWVTIGNAGFTPAQADNTTIAVDNAGTPYVSFQDAVTGRPSVMKFNGSSWVNVGSAGFSSSPSSTPVFALDAAGNVFALYSENISGKATVMKYNGTSWSAYGSAQFSAALAGSPGIALDTSGTPYVIYRDGGNGNKATVMLAGPSNVSAAAPSITAGSNALCPGGNTVLNLTGNLNDADLWQWYTGSCGGSSIGIGTSVTVTPSVTTTYYARGEGACVGAGNCGSITIIVNQNKTWYQDSDGDGFGNPSSSVVNCVKPSGYVQNKMDCNDNSANASILKFPGGAFSAGTVALTQVAIDTISNAAYMAYLDFISGKVAVMKYDGINWSQVGPAGFSAGSGYYIAIAVDKNGTPYVSYTDDANGSKLTVMKFNGSSWVSVGSPGITPGPATVTSIALDNAGIPYVAFIEASNRVSVMRFTGGSWSYVGASGFYAGVESSITIDPVNTLYLVCKDLNTGNITVLKYNGSNWTAVTGGTVLNTVADPSRQSIATDAAGTPYVIFTDNTAGSRITVAKYNGSTWVPVGNANFTAANSYAGNIALDASGTPYIVYTDGGNASRATMKKFDGSNWVNVGQGVFSSGTASFQSIAIDKYGMPFAVCQNADSGYKATAAMLTPNLSVPAAPVLGASATLICAGGSSTLTLTGSLQDASNWVWYAGGCGNGTAVGTGASITVSPTVTTTYYARGESSCIGAGNCGSITIVVNANRTWYQDNDHDGFGNPSSSVINCVQPLGYVLNKLDCNDNNLNGSAFSFPGGGFTQGSASFTTIAVDTATNTPYVAYYDGTNGGRISVMKYSNSIWTQVGNPGFSAGSAFYVSIAVDKNGTPYVAFADVGNSSRVSVMKYNGASWVNVGSPGISGNAVNSLSIAIDGNGNPYVCFTELSGGPAPASLSVEKFNGSAWSYVGAPQFISAIQASIAIDASNKPWVVCKANGYITLLAFNGSSWTTNTSANTGTLGYRSIAIDGNSTPYVIFCDGSQSATVNKFLSNSWTAVGPAPLSGPVSGNYISIAIDPLGTPVVAYSDSRNIGRATMKKFNGTNWVAAIGNGVFSSAQADDVSITVDKYGIPFAVCKNFDSAQKATAATAIVALTRAAIPNAAAVPVSVCIGGSATLTVTGSLNDATDWVWYAGGCGIGTPIGTGAAITVSPLTTTTYYVRGEGPCVPPGNCKAVTVNVAAAIGNNTISGTQTVCTGTGPVALTGVIPTGGNGSFTYQWQLSTDNNTFSDVPGGFNSFYNIPFVAWDVWFRRNVVSGGCSSTSSSVKVTALPTITNNSVSSSQIICTGTIPATLSGPTPSGGDGVNYTYQWQVSTNNSTYASISGATADIYAPPALNANTWYRRTATSGGCVNNSPSVAITVNNTIGNNTVAGTQSVCPATSPTILNGNTPTGGDGNYSYQWLISTDNLSYANAGNSNTVSYTPGVLVQTSWFKRSVVSGGCSSISAPVQVTVSSISNNNISSDQSVCSGTIPTTLTGTTPAGGNGVYTYQWQSSTDNSVYTNITGATSANYSPLAATQTLWYRRIVNATGCSDVSAPVKISVGIAIGNNSISADQTICGASAVPVTLAGSTPTGGNGVSYVYQWMKSTDNISFNNIIATDNISYDPPALVQTSYFKRVVSSGGCTAVSNAVTITINPAGTLFGNSISADQTLCSGAGPAAFSGSAVTGGDGLNYTFQWQSSTDNNVFSNIASATNSNYASPVLTETTWFRRLAFSAGCNSASAAIKMQVDSLIGNNLISTNQVICTGTAPAALTGTLPTGGNGNSFSYQWQSSIDNQNFANIGGATGSNYAPSGLSQTTWFRRVVVSGSCGTNASAAVKITVSQIISANSVTQNQSICIGTAPSALNGSVPSGGDNTSYEYQWYTSTDNNNFVAITGATAVNYTPPVLGQTAWFRRDVSSGGCSASSSSIQVVVTNVVNNSINASQTICTGSAPAILTGSAPSGGGGSYQYQWQSSTDNTNFNDISLAVNANYAPAALTQTSWFRRIVSANGCSNISSFVKITVGAAVTGNTIGSDQTICGISAIPVTLSGNDFGTGYTYQWQSSTDNVVYTNINGVITKNYDPPALLQTTYFKRVVNSTGCSGASNTATITINATGTLSGNSITAPQTICSGATPAALTGTTVTGGDNVNYTFQWQRSTDNNIYSNIGSATSINYAPAAMTQTAWFRRVAFSAGCNSASAPVKLQVDSVITNNTIANDQSICTGTSPATITGPVPGGGNGVYDYQWQSSADNIVYTNIVSGTNRNYAPPVLLQTTWYKRTVSSGVCGVQSSAAVKITVNSAVTNNTLSQNQAICTGTAPANITGSVASGGDGSYTYQWLSSTDNSSFTGVANGSSANYASPALAQTTWFKRQVLSGGCSNLSAPMQVIVSNLSNNNIAGDQIICTGSAPATLTGTTVNGGDGNYTYQWQSSTDNINFSNAGTGINYSPGPISQTTWYRRTVNATGCSSTSASVKITVGSAVTGNSIGTDQTICGVNAAPATLTGNDFGIGYSYQWQSSTDNISYTNISGVTTKNYDPPALPQTTYFKRLVSSVGCSSASGAVKITINATGTLFGNTISAAQTICSGATPAALTGTPVTGGDNVNYSFQWQSSIDNNLFSNIGSATSPAYSPASLTRTTWYRRLAISAGCNSSSAVVKIQVDSLISNNAISASQSICSGSAPATLTGTLPTGGNGNYSYQWQSSTDNNSFNTIAGAVSADYSPGPLSQTTWFRRTVLSGSCGTQSSASVKITVSNAISNNTITQNQSICTGTAPAVLNGSAPAGGDGNFNYQWLISTDNINYTAVPGAASVNYLPVVLTQTSWYKRMVSSGGCSNVSGVVQVTVGSLIGNNNIGSSQLICTSAAPSPLNGTAPSGGDGSNYAYQWQISTDNINFTNISNAITAAYSPAALAQTNWFRRIVGSSGCTNTSAALKVTVSNISNNLIGTSQSICAGSIPATLSGNEPSGGGGVYTYQWQSSTDNIQYTNSSNGTDAGFSPPVVSQNTWFRRVATAAGCSNASDPVKITINAQLVNNTIGYDQTICGTNGVPARLNGTVATGGDGVNYLYQWQSSTDNINFTGIAGVVTRDYDPRALHQTMYFNRTINSGGCGSLSNTITITLDTAGTLFGNSITGTQEICVGKTPAKLNGSAVTGGDNLNYTFQWQSSTDNNLFNDIAGATDTNYIPAAATTTMLFRRLAYSAGCNSSSGVITIKVDSAITNNQIGNSQLICAGTSPQALSGSLPGGGNGTQYNYQWMTSDNGASYSNISNASAAGYTPGPMQRSGWFKRIVTSGNCAADTSAFVMITVTDTVSSNTITGTAGICNGATSLLSGSVPAGGNGNYAYQWQSSTDNQSFGNLATATNASFTSPALNQSTWFRRAVSSGGCVQYSSSVQTIVYPPVANNGIGNNQVICTGTAPQLLTGTNPTGGDGGNYAYQWQTSTDSSRYTNNNQAIGVFFIPPALTQTSWIRRVVTSGGCESFSAPVKISVSRPVTNNTITNNQTICEGSAPVVFSGSTPAGGDAIAYSYLWQYSTDSTNYYGINGGTDPGFASGELEQTTWFRRVISSGKCELVSAPVKVLVNPHIIKNTASPDQLICAGTSTILTAGMPEGGDGHLYAYQWQTSPDNQLYNNSANGNRDTLYSPVLNQNNWFRRYVYSGTCVDVSGVIKVAVTPRITNDTVSASQIICENTKPAILSGSIVGGGNGKYQYQWQDSIINKRFGNISAANGTAYSPTALKQNTWYRRITVSGACSDTSSIIRVSVNPVIANNTVAADRTICAGTVPAAVGGTATTGGDGVYAYQWISSYDNLVFEPVTGAVKASYGFPPLSQTLYMKRVVSSGACVDTSSVLTITVQPQIGNDLVSASQDICPGGTAQAFTGMPLTGGNNIYRYRWQTSADSLQFTDVFGATGATYTAAPVVQTVFYRRVTVSGACTDTSNILRLQVSASNSCSIIVNAFSPNGDGIHDTWEIPLLSEYPNCTVRVFDRYGTRIFESRGYRTAWDGKLNGRDLPVGTYYFMIDLGNGGKVLSGGVTIIK